MPLFNTLEPLALMAFRRKDQREIRAIELSICFNDIVMVWCAINFPKSTKIWVYSDPFQNKLNSYKVPIHLKLA